MCHFSLFFPGCMNSLSLFNIVIWWMSLTNQKDVLSLRLPRLRHQAHKELYAYKQVSTPVTNTHAHCSSEIKIHRGPIIKQKCVRSTLVPKYQFSWCRNKLADSSGLQLPEEDFGGNASQLIKPLWKYFFFAKFLQSVNCLLERKGKWLRFTISWG